MVLTFAVKLREYVYARTQKRNSYRTRTLSLSDFDVSWAVLAGLWSEVNFGIGPGAMAKLLIELESVAEARPLLELFAGSKSDHIVKWAKEVLALTHAK